MLSRYQLSHTQSFFLIDRFVHQLSALDVKVIRMRIGMTQAAFAQAIGISVSTLRHWERGDRTPKGPARVLLNLVARAPETILQLLRGETKNPD